MYENMSNNFGINNVFFFTCRTIEFYVVEFKQSTEESLPIHIISNQIYHDFMELIVKLPNLRNQHRRC